MARRRKGWERYLGMKGIWASLRIFTSWRTGLMKIGNRPFPFQMRKWCPPFHLVNHPQASHPASHGYGPRFIDSVVNYKKDRPPINTHRAQQSQSPPLAPDSLSPKTPAPRSALFFICFPRDPATPAGVEWGWMDFRGCRSLLAQPPAHR